MKIKHAAFAVSALALTVARLSHAGTGNRPGNAAMFDMLAYYPIRAIHS
jgi:hypothetical protein